MINVKQKNVIQHQFHIQQMMNVIPMFKDVLQMVLDVVLLHYLNVQHI